MKNTFTDEYIRNKTWLAANDANIVRIHTAKDAHIG